MPDLVMETDNYALFELLDFNRDIQRIGPLVASMQKHGFLSPYPIHVSKGKNGRLRIKAGHHRFIAARQLGIPVKYVVSNDAATIHELERSSRKWGLEDYLASYVKCGNHEYEILRDFKEQSGLSIRTCLYLLTGQVYDDEKGPLAITAFKDGNFKVTSAKLAYWIVQLAKASAKDYFLGATHYNFIIAITKVLVDGAADYKSLKKQLLSWGHTIRLCSNVQDYIKEIERVYNFKSRKKLPIAYFIEDAETRRRKKESSHA